jgi:NAD(P)-dependent dehydrogenase (short-subunit alcohol dehydrogenase family)
MNAEDVILITHADTDTGFLLARRLLATGHRVVVTAPNPTSLSRILLGESADRVIAIAADMEDRDQRIGTFRRVQARFASPVTQVIDGRDPDSGQPIALLIAS